MEMDWSKNGQTNFRLARGLWQKNFPLRNDLPNLEKKIVSLSYFLFVGSCFKERNRFGADFFQKNFSFCRKRVPEGQFPSPRMTFPFKGRPIDFVFFFPASTEKASRLPAGESSNDLCLSVTKLSVTNLERSFSYIISWRCSGLSPIPPCRLPSAWTVAIENEPCTTQLFAEKQTVKQRIIIARLLSEER